MVPNAFAAGMDPSHALVTVTQGLLLLLDRRELEGVLAHELSHIGNRDTRLNTMVAAIALFLRLPHLLRRRAMRQRVQATRGNFDSDRLWRSRLASVALLPLYIYIFAVAPALAALLRAAISRSRESLADADAVLLTRYPEGLIRALAKIAGAGSLMAQSNPAVSHLYFADPSAGRGRIRMFTGRLLATHPPIEDRIARLCEVNAGLPLSVIESAVKAGQEFSQNHPELPERLSVSPAAKDELEALNTGNRGGKAARLKSSGTAVYEAADVKSRVLEQLRQGEFVISMSDYGNFHQVVTARQTFGYIQRSVKLEEVDILPAEVFDPEAQKAALLAAEQKHPESGISEKHIAIAIIFGLVVFAAVIVILVIVAGR
jgi:heat shock protein HtpX